MTTICSDRLVEYFEGTLQVEDLTPKELDFLAWFSEELDSKIKNKNPSDSRNLEPFSPFSEKQP